MSDKKQVKIYYKNMASFQFQQLIEKLKNTPTNNRAASKIHHVVKSLSEIRKSMIDDYQKKLINAFAEKDEKGKPVIDQETGGFKIVDGKMDEFKALEKTFGETHKELGWIALFPDDLKDVQLTALEIEMLGEAYCEVPHGPGLPDEGNVRNLR